MTELPVPPDTGSDPAALTPTAVNDDGVVVGLSGGMGATFPFAYVGTRSIVPLQSRSPGVLFYLAVDVGDRGQAIGYGLDQGYSTTPYRWDLPRR